MILLAMLMLQAPSLVGDWAAVEPHRDSSLPVEPCATDNGVRYEADGRFSDFLGDEQGRWQVRRGVLTEHVTHRYDENQESRPVRERAGRWRLRWLSPNHVNLISGRTVYGLIRCP